MVMLSILLEKTAAMHHQLCPRQVLGVRMGILAGKLLDLDLPQEEKRLFVFMETDGCAADGVSVSTGCWVGRRTMRIIDFGKVAATFVDTKTDRAYRIHPHPACRSRSREYFPEAESEWHAQRDAYQHLTDEELLLAIPVELEVDLKSIIGQPGVRTDCTICGEEIINQRELVHEGSVLCLGCAGENYFKTISASIPSRV